MALSESALSTEIETELKNVFGNPANAQKLKNFCDAIAKSMVTRFVADTVVSTTVTTPDTINGTGEGTIS